MSNRDYTFKKIKSINLGGKKFSSMPVTINQQGIESRQILYCKFIEDYCLSIAITYTTQEEFIKLNKILSNIQFD